MMLVKGKFLRQSLFYKTIDRQWLTWQLYETIMARHSWFNIHSIELRKSSRSKICNERNLNVCLVRSIWFAKLLCRYFAMQVSCLKRVFKTFRQFDTNHSTKGIQRKNPFTSSSILLLLIRTYSKMLCGIGISFWLLHFKDSHFFHRMTKIGPTLLWTYKRKWSTHKIQWH